MSDIKIAPSIVSADLAHLADQLKQCEAAGAGYIHIDVMDGRFVPAITIGWPIVEAIRRNTNLPLDVHLMVAEPEKQIDQFMDAGGDVINVHVEAATDLAGIIDHVHSRGKEAGVCLNPGTPASSLDAVLPGIEQVMVMSVNPGASGQAFIEDALPKVAHFRSVIDANGYRARIEIDGGVKPGNAPRCAAAGADVLVAASAIFNTEASIARNIAILKEAVSALAPRQ
jgi:ribulose-phosphate 3-epimerase